jgi:hypothetical protein
MSIPQRRVSMMGFSDSSHFRKTLAGMCMVLTPLFALAAWVVAPRPHTGEAAQLASIAGHTDRFLVSTLFAMAAIACAIGATLGLMHMLRERRSVNAGVGGLLAVVGLMTWLASTGIDMMLWQMARDGVQAGDVSALTGLRDATVPAIVLFWAPLLTAVGYVVLAAGMLSAKVVDWWMAAMIGIAPVLLVVAGLAASVPVGLIGSAVMLVGLGATGMMVLREADADWEHTPDWHGFRPVAQ